MRRVAVALVHWPCVDRAGELYATSVTNLDIHDIARSSRTYGVDAYYVVHPIKAQQELATAIARFWDDGKARDRNPDRTEALSRVRVVESLEAAISAETAELGSRPLVLSTSAKGGSGVWSYDEARHAIASGPGTLVVFGTGHGLAQQALDLTDALVAPIDGADDYNHLAVRSAVAIILDRLLATTR